MKKVKNYEGGKGRERGKHLQKEVANFNATGEYHKHTLRQRMIKR